MSDNWPKWKVFYRLKTYDAISDWQEADLRYNHCGVDPPPVARISAPDGLLQGIHWRMSELSDFFKPLLTEATQLYDLRFELDESS